MNLLPCPFCGDGEPVHNSVGLFGDDGEIPPDWRIHCLGCEAVGPAVPRFTGMNAAAVTWNTRRDLGTAPHSERWPFAIDGTEPCPFCGGADIRLGGFTRKDWVPFPGKGVPRARLHAECAVCRARTRPKESPQGAAQQWDFRSRYARWDMDARGVILIPYEEPEERNLRFTALTRFSDEVEDLASDHETETFDLDDWQGWEHHAIANIEEETIPTEDLEDLDFLYFPGRGASPSDQPGNLSRWTDADEYDFRNGLGRFWSPALGWDVKKYGADDRRIALDSGLLTPCVCGAHKGCVACKGAGYMASQTLKKALERDERLHSRLAKV